MRVQTFLNRVFKAYIKSFVFKEVFFETDSAEQLSFIVEIEPRKNGLARCSICGRICPCYDRQKEPRRFEIPPIFNMKGFFSYHMRRVECPHCGVKVEKIPWAEGKSHLTTSYQLFLARWAKRLSWEETARIFKTSWDSVYRSVKHVVNYGLKHRILNKIEAIGVDEVQYEEGQKYITIVYEIGENCKRLLYVSKDRTVESLLGFFQEIGPQCSNNIKFVCSDMWQPFLNAIKQKIPQALHILDHFHIVANLNKALDQVRREEVAELKSQGYENPLTHSRYCLLKNPENLTFSQARKLKLILKYKLKTTRAYLLKDSFQFFWLYTNPCLAQ